jgi:hypothetical protein
VPSRLPDGSRLLAEAVAGVRIEPRLGAEGPVRTRVWHAAGRAALGGSPHTEVRGCRESVRWVAKAGCPVGSRSAGIKGVATRATDPRVTGGRLAISAPGAALTEAAACTASAAVHVGLAAVLDAVCTGRPGRIRRPPRFLGRRLGETEQTKHPAEQAGQGATARAECGKRPRQGIEAASVHRANPWSASKRGQGSTIARRTVHSYPLLWGGRTPDTGQAAPVSSGRRRRRALTATPVALWPAASVLIRKVKRYARRIGRRSSAHDGRPSQPLRHQPTPPNTQTRHKAGSVRVELRSALAPLRRFAS